MAGGRAAVGALPAVLMPEQCRFFLRTCNGNPEVLVVIHPQWRITIPFQQCRNLVIGKRRGLHVRHRGYFTVFRVELDCPHTVAANACQQIERMIRGNFKARLHTRDNRLRVRQQITKEVIHHLAFLTTRR
ncbi:hypothetical protein D3C80_1312930 [compost metagenome]